MQVVHRVDEGIEEPAVVDQQLPAGGSVQVTVGLLYTPADGFEFEVEQAGVISPAELLLHRKP